MPVINRIADMADEIAAWRHDIHAHPELGFEVHRTAGVVAEKLRSFGCDEVFEGIGRTGVVGVIRGQRTGSGHVIGLRADMDALPIQEVRDLPYKSTSPGHMHACGHDGHTAMLLGAARYLAETRNFDGTAVVIFQPAEEGGGGGREMVNDGLMERFGIQKVFGMHNYPGLPVGQFAIRPGPIMAAADLFTIRVEGVGGHAARPHACIDTTLVAAQILTALQSVVARNVDPIENAVVSVTSVDTGPWSHNVIPQHVELTGTARALAEPVRDLVEDRIGLIARHTARAFGAVAEYTYVRDYPVTINGAAEAGFAGDVAEQVAGQGRVDRDVAPVMGGEDFSFMLNARPGALIWVGNGDTAGVHHPEYDFNDEAIPYGCSYWARLVETAMPA
ncbi:M20 aminoacylase family protein [Paralimibaculum aggregatum]|uniref:M20 aminoacylase family protein n=1 Tax=Paralimibaculum aggregatum TaxID=3036245 RepID=A0ABQ6LHH5_9RHOB|nr:M20 aminoacylase family protein [Limibaculum sp. NKW23]GMG82743.1 M20 aminoacylase family protein [Limibaculum sp. NKW23]